MKRVIHTQVDEAGVLHYIIPLIVVVLVAIIGVRYVVSSHAESPNASTADSSLTANATADTTSCPFANAYWFKNGTKSYAYIAPYGYDNNIWNYHSGDHQTICANKTSTEWGFMANMPKTYYAVQSYPEQIYTQGSGKAVNSYSDIKSCVTFSTSSFGTGKRADIAYDTWLNRGKSNQSEVMVWLDHQNNVPAGSDQHTTITDDNVTYEVWRDSNKQIDTFVAKSNTTSACVDLKQLYDYLSNKYGINLGAWSEGDFGGEIDSTDGVNFSVTVTKTTWHVD